MKHLLTILLYLCPLLSLGQVTLSNLNSMHVVTKGDTWESVAQQHGVTVEELMAANIDMARRKLKAGKLLAIPERKQVPETPAQPEEQPVSQPDHTVARQLRVGVLLPFDEARMVDFYRGLLMAADKVRRGGTTIDFFAWDSGKNFSSALSKLDTLGSLDILFASPSASQTVAVAEACRQTGTRLVLPFSDAGMLGSYPLAYAVAPSFQSIADGTAQLIGRFFADKNYIIVKSGLADTKGHQLTETLIQTLARKGVAIKTLNLDADDSAFETILQQNKDNWFMIDDSQAQSFHSLCARLKEFRRNHPAYHIALLGYPSWQVQMQTIQSDSLACDVYIPSTYFYNESDSRTKAFERAYGSAFRGQMSADSPRPAALGYDLGLYFLGGISIQGDTFEQMQGHLQQDPIQNRFDFKLVAPGMSLANGFVQLLHLLPDKKIEIIR